MYSMRTVVFYSALFLLLPSSSPVRAPQLITSSSYLTAPEEIKEEKASLPSTLVPCLHTFLKESVQAFHSNNSTTIFLPQAVLYCPPCFPHSDLVAALNSQLVSSIKGPKRLPQHGTMVFFSLPLVPLHNPDSIQSAMLLWEARDRRGCT